MSKPTHTPGPWYVHAAEYEDDSCTVDTEADSIGRGYFRVAGVSRPADARLCAAAPDLLAVALNLVALADQGIIRDGTTVGMAKAAIRKATETGEVTRSSETWYLPPVTQKEA